MDEAAAETSSPKPKGGQNKLELSDDQVRQVGVMTRLGLRMEDVADVLSIGVATLKRMADRDKRVGDTLKKGRDDKDQKVVETAFRMAVSGKSPAVTIFWLKVRLGWKESHRFEHTGVDGGSIRTQSKVDLAKLSSDQLKVIEQAMGASDAAAG